MELRPGSGLKNRRVAKPPDRMCVGLFAAADALGLSVVRGVPPHLYMERLDPDILQKLGLAVVEDSGRLPNVYIRIPANKEAILRPVVLRDNLPVSDVVQMWLDASANQARGREQADEIRRRVLKPRFGVVIIGGWAHRLYRQHPAAQVPDYPPLVTLDTDIALIAEVLIQQDIRSCWIMALRKNSSVTTGRLPLTIASAMKPRAFTRSSRRH
jgi:hypothetical protein